MKKAMRSLILLFIVGAPVAGMSQTDNNFIPSARSHAFLDKTNIGLFAGVTASRMMDYASTQYFRRRGNDEALLTNNIVDNKPFFVAIEISGTAASAGVSYLFHATGHHKLERWASIVHIGITTFGFARNYMIAWNKPLIRF